MRARSSLFGLAALAPFVLGPALAQARAPLLLPLCSGDGIVRSLAVPFGPAQLPAEGEGAHCDKACHAGSSRKKTTGTS